MVDNFLKTSSMAVCNGFLNMKKGAPRNMRRTPGC